MSNLHLRVLSGSWSLSGYSVSPVVRRLRVRSPSGALKSFFWGWSFPIFICYLILEQIKELRRQQNRTKYTKGKNLWRKKLMNNAWAKSHCVKLYFRLFSLLSHSQHHNLSRMRMILWNKYSKSLSTDEWANLVMFFCCYLTCEHFKMSLKWKSILSCLNYLVKWWRLTFTMIPKIFFSKNIR